MGKVRSPTRSTAAPSTKRSVDTVCTGPPAASAAVMLGAPAGSTPTRRVAGECARNQVAMPASSPPPPTGTTSVPTGSASWPVISTATVPWPAMVRRSSKGWT